MSQEKGPLDILPPQSPSKSHLSRHRTKYLLLPALFIFLLIHGWWQRPVNFLDHSRWHRHSANSQCGQVPKLMPSRSSDKLADMDEYFRSSNFRNESIVRLSDAVKIPTMSYDDLGPIGEDKRWEIFYDFATYLKTIFPLIHERLSLDVVNTHGLIYTWNGTNSALKPTLLMAHQDVVPVPESTVDAWTHPPFDGFYDGKYIWGRGASDCKNQLIAIMEAVELLLKAGFEPQRSLILSFGFDEEVSGPQGAGHLAPFLLERYGKDSIAVIVDEGAGFSQVWGSTFATPGVAEKGYIDVEIIVRMAGGHSSIPPAHNGIGIMSELITNIEANPYEPRLYDQNPFLGFLQCGASHSPEFPHKLKKLLRKHKSQCHGMKDGLAHEVAKDSLPVRYLMQTSVAADVIVGGVKVNALPERTSAIINHRVNVGEHPSDVKAKLSALALHVAQKYNLTVHAFDDSKESPYSITLRTTKQPLEPAPVTPTNVDEISAYGIVSGTTRGLYGEKVLMAPGIMTGNTDTRYYWDLTRNIFRYAPGWEEGEDGIGRNIHTVDERASVVGHIMAARWFSAFVRNMDEADLP